MILNVHPHAFERIATGIRTVLDRCQGGSGGKGRDGGHGHH
jgi:hypothetical protein